MNLTVEQTTALAAFPADGMYFRARARFNEFTDVERMYFVIEPVHQQQIEPDMDAIRDAHQPPPGGEPFDH